MGLMEVVMRMVATIVTILMMMTTVVVRVGPRWL